VKLPADLATRHPLAFPIAFEMAEHAAIRRRSSFVATLRRELYRNLRPRSERDTLDILCRFIRSQQSTPTRFLRRVITFNADDLLEHGVNDGSDPIRAPVVWPIAREASRPRMERGALGRPPIPVYHVHGFLPQQGGDFARHEAANTLVFTEAQYWNSFAEPTSFPNRVILGALHDSVCVFIGLSMTDINLARWLGVRANGVERDSQRFRSRSAVSRSTSQRALDHHFWIRRTPEPESSEFFVTPLLRKRGVRAIDLDEWDELDQLLSRLRRG
jgi:hypothetical protein